MDLEQINSSEETISSPLDEFKDFLVELWNMIKQDFRNSINFISSNRNFFTTVALLAILLQVSSVQNLGASFEKYCDGREMRGGGVEPPILSYQDYKQMKTQAKAQAKEEKAQAKAEKKADETKAKREAKIDTKSKSMMAANQKKGVAFSEEHYKEQATKKITDKEQAKATKAQANATKAQANADKSALKKSRRTSIADYKAGVDEARDQDQLMKANKERISFFEGIKKKFNSTLSPGALGGPLFGRLDLIFDSVKSIFYIIAIILTIVGVLSLPVLAFLILTYYVFKYMLGKFIIL